MGSAKSPKCISAFRLLFGPHRRSRPEGHAAKECRFGCLAPKPVFGQWLLLVLASSLRGVCRPLPPNLRAQKAVMSSESSITQTPEPHKCSAIMYKEDAHGGDTIRVTPEGVGSEVSVPAQLSPIAESKSKSLQAAPCPPSPQSPPSPSSS